MALWDEYEAAMNEATEREREEHRDRRDAEHVRRKAEARKKAEEREQQEAREKAEERTATIAAFGAFAEACRVFAVERRVKALQAVNRFEEADELAMTLSIARNRL